jgi:pantoate--beta-alanine ligase
MHPASPVVARDRADLDKALTDSFGVRAVVMTMGALHAGHAALLRAARSRADQVIVTIFVNPLQFGPGEDLDRYPRTIESDLRLCGQEGVDVVFAPTVVHPQPPTITVSAGHLGEILEGAVRPGHFDGVLTIVATMLHLTRPDLAFFGQKDAQQQVLIRRMVADLAFPTEIITVPTVRDTDGLALSSRNAYLAPDARRAAQALPRALLAGRAAAEEGAGPDAVLAAGRRVLDQEPGVDVDYLTLVDPDTLRPTRPGDVSALLLVAARAGATRLIDNVPLAFAEGKVR